MKVDSDEIIEILHKYDTIASEVDRLGLCLEIADDDDLAKLLPKMNFDYDVGGTIMGLNIEMTPSDDNSVYPCDVTIKAWCIPGDSDEYTFEDIIFELRDGTVVSNKFDSEYDLLK